MRLTLIWMVPPLNSSGLSYNIDAMNFQSWFFYRKMYEIIYSPWTRI